MFQFSLFMKKHSVDFTLFRMFAVGANFLFFDVPEEFQMTLQDPATGIMEALIDFHHDLVFFFVIIVTLVFWLLGRLLYLFDQDHVDFRVAVINAIYRKKLEYIAVLPMNFSKNLVAEIIWTIIPFMILLYIMPSSFSLLYAMDDMMIPSVTMKCHGHQWFWNYNMADTRVFSSSVTSDLDFLMITEDFDTFFNFDEILNEPEVILGLNYPIIDLNIDTFETFEDLINFLPGVIQHFDDTTALENEVIESLVDVFLGFFSLDFDFDSHLELVELAIDGFVYGLGLEDGDADFYDFLYAIGNDEEANIDALFSFLFAPQEQEPDAFISVEDEKIFSIFLDLDEQAFDFWPLQAFLLHVFSTFYMWTDHYFDETYSVQLGNLNENNLAPLIASVTGISPAFLLNSKFDFILTATKDAMENAWLRSFNYDFPVVKKMQKLFFDSYMVGDSDLKPGQFRLLEVDKHICLPLQVFSRLLISAEDVIHSFAIPSLGVKMDAVPGRSNQVGVLIKRLGRFYGQCSEICGANHAFMPIVLECVSQVEFIKWYDSNSVYLPL